jgi:hypothetical protein
VSGSQERIVKDLAARDKLEWGPPPYVFHKCSF